MPRRASELTALEISRLTEPGQYPVGHIAGLMLYVKHADSRSWVLRMMVGKKRRHMGLGPYPAVTLAQARERAREARELVRQGIDPIEEQQRRQDALRAAQGRRVTFEEAAGRFLKRKTQEFRNPKHAAQWGSTLEMYAYPVLGKLAVSEIEIGHVVRALEPIWSDKTETATRVRGRIESVLTWATVNGYREGPNPAAWRNNLDAVLPKPGKLKNVEHHAAVPIDDAPAFLAEVQEHKGASSRAVEFCLLTAARSGEARAATWDEIDLERRTWTVPASRMKAGREHIVPLSDAAMALLEALPARSGLLFPSPRGKVMSPEALIRVMGRCGRSETVHGLRSTFRDWASERTNYAHEVAEQALAHTIANATERAYRRGSLLAKRARLMADWAKFLESPTPAGEVVPMERRA